MRLLKFIWWSCVAVFCGLLLSFSGAFLYLSPTLPSVESLRQVQLQIPLRVYSSDAKLIAEFGEMRRSPIRFDEIPKDFISALLAAEDDNFANHYGVDVTSLMRAATQLLKSGQIQSGGSTITMQVAKNFFLTNERSFSRKATEILLALQIERELSKDEILELYVNKIYLGHRAYGIEAAAQVYYGKSIRDLSLAQMAMIAGLPKAPSRYNPLVNPTRARNAATGSSVACSALAASTRPATSPHWPKRSMLAITCRRRRSALPISPRWHVRRWSVVTVARPIPKASMSPPRCRATCRKWPIPPCAMV